MKIGKKQSKKISFVITLLVVLSGCLLLLVKAIASKLEPCAFKIFIAAVIVEVAWLGYLIVIEE